MDTSQDIPYGQNDDAIVREASMPGRVNCFGGPFQSEILFAASEQDIVVRRELWFDQDIDGRWVIWVSEDRGPRDIPEAESPVGVGALIVRDPTVAAFLETLGELVLEPDHFAHEPRFGTDPQR